MEIGTVFFSLTFVVGFVLWVWALIDILKSDFKESINKFIWLCVVFFIPFIGVILYYFIGLGQKR